jgi:hypothetical protein
MTPAVVIPILVPPRVDYKYIALGSLALGQGQLILSDHLDASLRNVDLPFAYGLFGLGRKLGR